MPTLEAERPELERVSKYKFVGPNRDSRFYTDFGKEALDSRRLQLPRGMYEEGHTPEQSQQIGDVVDAITNYANKLGVDLSERIPAENYVKIFKPDTFARVRDAHRHPEGSLGFESGGHLVVEDGPQAPRVISHELLHKMSDKTYKVEVGKKPDGEYGRMVEPIRNGYELNKDKAMTGLNEAIEEWMNLDIQNTEWKNYDSLADKIGQEGEIYKFGVPQLRELVDYAAEQLDQDPTDLEHELFRGMFTGDKTGIRQIGQAVGPEKMRELVDVVGWGSDFLDELGISRHPES